MLLNEKALTANLRISAWTGRRYDKKVTSEIEQQHDTRNTGRFNKLLVAKEHISPVERAARKARDLHYFNTHPWNDNGERLLPSANYFQYVEGLNEVKTIFDAAVTTFLAGYDEMKQEAQFRLKDMYREGDYPSRSELEEKFGFRIEYGEIPGTDFRVGNLSEDEARKLKEQAEASLVERLNGAVKDSWRRVKEQLVRMQEILHNDNSPIYTTLVANLEELVDTLPRLNITEDPNIAGICQEMKGLIVPVGELRDSDALRKRKAQEVDDLMQKFSGFFS